MKLVLIASLPKLVIAYVPENITATASAAVGAVVVTDLKLLAIEDIDFGTGRHTDEADRIRAAILLDGNGQNALFSGLLRFCRPLGLRRVCGGRWAEFLRGVGCVHRCT